MRAGALHLFKEVLLRNVIVRILIPSNQEQIKQIINEVALTFPQLHIRSMDKSLDTHIGNIIVDRKESLIVELKDDTKENYYDAAGLSVYSKVYLLHCHMHLYLKAYGDKLCCMKSQVE